MTRKSVAQIDLLPFVFALENSFCKTARAKKAKKARARKAKKANKAKKARAKKA